MIGKVEDRLLALGEMGRAKLMQETQNFKEKELGDSNLTFHPRVNDM